MFFSYLVFIGFLSLPVWGIIFCLSLVSIIEKIKYEKEHKFNTFWFTLSFVIIITILAIITID